MLESLDELVSVNQNLYRRYQQELEGIPGVQLIEYDETEACNYQYIVVEIDDSATVVSRDQILKILWAENVLARRYFFPGCHRMEPYRSLFPDAGLSLSETERLLTRVLCLPTGSDVKSSEVVKICQLIRLIVEKSGQVTENLARPRN